MGHVPGRHQGAPSLVPLSVRYACALLSVQASLWALASLGGFAVWADKANWQPNVARGAGYLVWYVAAGLLVIAITGGLSATSFLLAARLQRGTSRARAATVGLEAFMTCFGVLIAYYTASAGAGIIAILPVLAGLTGSALSVTAAIALLGRHARAFTRRGSRSSAAQW